MFFWGAFKRLKKQWLYKFYCNNNYTVTNWRVNGYKQFDSISIHLKRCIYKHTLYVRHFVIKNIYVSQTLLYHWTMASINLCLLFEQMQFVNIISPPLFYRFQTWKRCQLTVNIAFRRLFKVAVVSIVSSGFSSFIKAGSDNCLQSCWRHLRGFRHIR